MKLAQVIEQAINTLSLIRRAHKEIEIWLSTHDKWLSYLCHMSIVDSVEIDGPILVFHPAVAPAKLLESFTNHFPEALFTRTPDSSYGVYQWDSLIDHVIVRIIANEIISHEGSVVNPQSNTQPI